MAKSHPPLHSTMCEHVQHSSYNIIGMGHIGRIVPTRLLPEEKEILEEILAGQQNFRAILNIELLRCNTINTTESIFLRSCGNVARGSSDRLTEFRTTAGQSCHLACILAH